MTAESVSGPRTDRKQQLRLFFSADLVNGTDFKSRRPTERFPPKGKLPAWPTRFETFFTEFINDFRERVAAARNPGAGRAILAHPTVWKLNGDEVLFTELVYPLRDDLLPALSTSVHAFVELVSSYDKELLPEGMGVRGCVWTAGFPIRNTQVWVSQGTGIPIIGSTARDFDTGDFAPAPAVVTDYIGRDIDLGFRLASTVAPGRVACSVDVADYVSTIPDDLPRVHVFHVGWRRLKGIADDHPYPMLWLDTEAKPTRRHPWDEWDSQSCQELQTLLADPRAASLDSDEVVALADELRSQLPSHFIKPYASQSDIDHHHKELWKRDGVPDNLEVGASAATRAELSAHVATPSSVPMITADDLNQLQILLQTDDELPKLLDDVLRRIAEHEAYVEWSRVAQFDGLLFRMPAGLVFADDDRRRLLEKLSLIVDDVLRVKVGIHDSKLFLTDGLWVPGEIRVFPFSDESDLLREACQKSGWDDWATCVIDPAIGCGHNLLRYPDPAVRRYGFDINARAVTYAAINKALNEIESTVVGVNDGRTTWPAVFTQREAERVLVMANMPIALVPESNTLPRSADGGRHGFEVTSKVLERIAELERSLGESSEVRCLVLTYSLGNVRDDRWNALEWSQKVFGADRVAWQLLETEKLWRVNGTKDEDNPMPLDHLERKADCRFYVRRDADRPNIRKKYQNLTRELLDRGWDHLAYGVIAVS